MSRARKKGIKGSFHYPHDIFVFLDARHCEKSLKRANLHNGVVTIKDNEHLMTRKCIQTHWVMYVVIHIYGS